MTDKITFPEALARGVLVFDGAMGTEIYRHHVYTNRCFDELALTDPKLIRGIHQDYCDAGADVLTTNTFGANRATLAQFGLAERMKEIILAAVRLAREAAGTANRPVYVAGSIGPLPSQPEYRPQIEGMILEQVDALREGGADFVLFETQPNREALEKCASAMRYRPDVPFVLSFAVVRGGETASGEPLSRMLAPLGEGLPQPTAWGINCGTGPDGLLPVVEQAVRLTERPLIVQPNAGEAKEVGGRRIYLCSPEYLTTYAQRFVALGASAVGGCCGTTPEHIREMAKAIKPLARAAIKAIPTTVEATEQKPAKPLAERSNLGRMLTQRLWVKTIEILPPRGYDLGSTITKAKTLKNHGVAAINIPDGPRASSRLSPLVTAARIEHEAGIETILHFCCRDRNLIGMQADLLGCAAFGVHNILFITGDPPKLGNYPNATGVFDTDSIGMAAVQRRLNCGIDLGGQAIDPQTHAVIGVGCDPTALDQQREVERFRQKVEAGAEFAISQPVFEPEALLRFLDKVSGCGVPIIAGIWPLASYRNALFMKNEVPGVIVPDAIMQRMAAEESREGQLAVGVEIARESIERVRGGVCGVQVSAPLGKIEIALQVLEG